MWGKNKKNEKKGTERVELYFLISFKFKIGFLTFSANRFEIIILMIKYH